ncbi:hypothetical protein JXA88_16510 [Candidatus Fermentibacteria bacterium]|nr:hypothetical protein [Candidatus Fermentibacteria bacterium]
MTQGDPLLVVSVVATVLERLGIRYAIGGSLASSLYGIPRATQDADIVARVCESHASILTHALQGEFYVDEYMIREAVRRRTSFNVIHLATMFKVDIFVAKGDEWSNEELLRARCERVGEAGAPIELVFTTAEDTVLHKLLWYRMGGEVSERQWRDAIGVLRVQGSSLDGAYLAAWARRLGLRELLDRATAEAMHEGKSPYDPR